MDRLELDDFVDAHTMLPNHMCVCLTQSDIKACAVHASTPNTQKPLVRSQDHQIRPQCPNLVKYTYIPKGSPVQFQGNEDIYLMDATRN